MGEIRSPQARVHRRSSPPWERCCCDNDHLQLTCDTSSYRHQNIQSCTDVATKRGGAGGGGGGGGGGVENGGPCLPLGREVKSAELNMHRFRGVPVFQGMGSQHQSEELLIDTKQT